MTDLWPAIVHETTLQRAAQVGLATQAFWRSGLPPHQSWMLQAYILPAIPLRQLAFQFDHSGQASAVITWACVSGRTDETLLSNPNRMLHLSEWNDGTSLWIMSLFGDRGQSAALIRRMLKGPFAKFASLKGYQRNVHGEPFRLRRFVHINRGNEYDDMERYI